VDLEILAYADEQQKLQPKPNDYWLKKGIQQAVKKGSCRAIAIVQRI
jgi:hypothetical protein